MKIPTIKEIVTNYLSNTSREEYALLKRVLGEPKYGPSESTLIRQGAENATRYYDVPGLSRVRHDAPDRGEPKIYTEQELVEFLTKLVSLCSAKCAWVDMPFWLGAHLKQEIHRQWVWHDLERAMAMNNKRPSLETMYADCFVIKGRPYWLVRIVVVCGRAYENSLSSFPMITL